MKTVPVALSTPPRQHSSRIGRPSKQEANIRQEELLDAAADLFLEHGYDRATLELIARSVGMTKRTIYSRFDDKATLFRATIQRAIEVVTANQQTTLDAISSLDLKQALSEVARMRLLQVSSPIAIKLNRLVNAESYRFPDIFAMTTEQVTEPVVRFLADVLRRHANEGSVIVSQPELSASAFMSMVAGGPARILAAGNRVDKNELERRVQFCVDLLLDGLRPRIS